MPRDPFKPLTPQEQATVFHYVREGCHEENLRIVERKAKLPKGKGLEIVRRKHVAQEIERRKAMVEMEQARLIARDQNRNAEAEDRRQRVTLDKLEKTLDRVLDLDPKTHSGAVLEGVRIGLVYAGIAKSGKLERVIPVKHPEGETQEGEVGDGMYRSVFASLAADVPAAPEPAQLLPGEAGSQQPPASSPPVAPLKVPAVQQPAASGQRPAEKPVQPVQAQQPEIQFS